MSLLLSKDGDSYDGGFGWVTSLDDQSCVGIDEVVTVGAAKERLGDDGVLTKRCLGVELLLEDTVAARAAKLSVEGFLHFVRWCELVSVALNGSSTELGIHLFEDRHAKRVTEWQQ